MPPPRARTFAFDPHAGVHRLDDRPVGRRCELRLEPQPSAPGELLLDRADAGRALGVVARVVLERGGMVQVEAAGHGVGRAGGAAPRRIPYRPVIRPLIESADVAVVGAGAAGLYTALVAAGSGARVVLVSSSPLAQSASYWAAGVGLRLRWTLMTAWTCTWPTRWPRGAAPPTWRWPRSSAEAPERVRELSGSGSRSTARPARDLLLSLEGGHTRRRVAHAGGGATGRHVTARLSELVTSEDRIEVRAHICQCTVGRGRPLRGRRYRVGGDPGRRDGARDRRRRGPLEADRQPARGDRLGHDARPRCRAARTWSSCSSTRPPSPCPESSTGSWSPRPYAATALLLTDEGERFVDELAPRDEVTLAMQSLMSAGRHAFLDLRPVDMRAFPNIVERLAGAGIDPERDLVPVAPAAHYMIGGVVTDEHGRSTLGGLYAVGECACTGVHGANRLASNSLSECFVFGRRAAWARSRRPCPPRAAHRVADPPGRPGEETRAALWHDAGPVRDAAGLTRLAADPYRSPG